tara:strand:+ start:59548 stop:59994 length:447 start_codon:yes stop_codon:yes gene_type:complete
MRFYETLYIINPNFENEKLKQSQKEIESELSKTNSKVINHRVWSKKRLAYAIEKQKYGIFILLQYSGGDLDKLKEFDTWMKLNNKVLRHMTVVLKSEPGVYTEEEQESKKNETEANQEQNEESKENQDELKDPIDMKNEEAENGTTTS